MAIASPCAGMRLQLLPVQPRSRKAPLGEASVLRGAVSYSMLHATVADLVA
ncbi:hypothetical protein [Noviherbaspirillum sp. Root189]|uniref:hypothetical protein n=1 Tax=Noviherbaspirillum sp. Root189 TaxID=1736487 RepID=UPI0012E3F7EB|nr:hypothetical protein [Noviherbaspirillum sp. Root189]